MKTFFKKLNGSRGEFLLEAVIAVLIFTLVGVAVLSGVAMTHRSEGQLQRQAIAENLIRNQMEKVFSTSYLDYPAAYPTIVPPTGYSVSTVTQDYTSGVSQIQRVLVSVEFNGTTLMSRETLRAKD